MEKANKKEIKKAQQIEKEITKRLKSVFENDYIAFAFDLRVYKPADTRHAVVDFYIVSQKKFITGAAVDMIQRNFNAHPVAFSPLEVCYGEHAGKMSALFRMELFPKETEEGEAK